ncbi:taste receptor type 2 member 1-like [Sphaerodactylus townsendi]|uniref:taste receptor type 2 member 1-like n=1 Tax=Sphaerodactylus townsendi TaxID=933632 RepID=UPI002027535A|nr:taste receptor type 2 member 1-like [Sphaerodactylus townsendi]
MSTSLAIGFALLVLNTLVGMMANGFIVLFICIDWFRSRKSSPTDLILGCIGLSRFLWHMIAIMTSIMAFFFKHTNIQNFPSIMISATWFFVNSVNLWFAALLSVLYFVKVAIFSHPLFLQMKQRYSGLVPWLLLASVVFSAALTIIIITTGTNAFSTCHSYQSLSSNRSSSEIQTLNFCKNFVILYYAPNIIPSMLFLSSSILLISSLGKHIRHLQNSGSGIKDLNMQIHLTAIKVLVSFTVLYLSSFIAVILLSVESLNSEVLWTAAIFANVSAMYPSAHALILILVNPKLKEGCVRMLHHFKCHLSEASS